MERLLKAATKVFIGRGYRRTTMADIAREMGVAPGTIYLYVESKEALFHLLAMRSTSDSAMPLPELPVKTPPAGATIALLREALSLEKYAPRLAAWVKAGAGGEGDLEAVLGELYDSAYSHRDGINLIERSSFDWPEMAKTFYDGLRNGLVNALSAYLAQGAATGAFRLVPHIRVAARFVVETIAWFAVHRHGDPGGKDFDDDQARETAIDMVVASIVQHGEEDAGGSTLGGTKNAGSMYT